MTPAARVAASAGILDEILAGAPAEKALTAWARRSRFAGSKDRAAVRDHVFDVLRRRKSCAAMGGGGGRGLMLGLLRLQGVDPEEIFTGEGHAPAPLDGAEREVPAPGPVIDLPDWIVPRLRADLGADFARTEAMLKERAPVMLRVNLARISREAACERLVADGIAARPDGIAPTALRVEAGARRIRSAAAYLGGEVELQDGSSQAAVAAIDMAGVARVLDYCAGGGGKSLALAARSEATILAHDAHPARMSDLPARAARAGVRIATVNGPAARAGAPYDLVLCDVPCSGSGTWRRTPDAKWRFSEEDLSALIEVQDGILDEAAHLAGRGGRIAYMTCSLLVDENEARAEAFSARHPDWRAVSARRWPVTESGDGFFSGAV
ncbi:RsmB/NOP family class I SAM-dependent RNA methyltransferase [Roseovarius sp. SCSIO 43702]|uniref:RsmB/NOP family class I SAM-dependent RNA methyltransferase n=1 Tax=Roseovarius sp. SCSIO 43702 TaxID=2823043 RepID=UPI001C73C3BC|nr:RsmB/NOP family class I SAM-dependent RNA methyltransferase [Roseovarius sp. SCSIO 43702]QYX58385.1 RsmB/NOP family class I SAM-dependent RNA methyltransferase [Roseovarius sp. SCSIO 43702]